MDTVLNIVDNVYHADLKTILSLSAGTVVLVHLIPYLVDKHSLRKYPGPFLAKFSDIWLGVVSRKGHRSEVIHALHQKYGPIVRIAPNQLSIADPDALQTVYAHGNGTLKSDFYDAFVSIQRGVFNTRDRAEHSRKRKIVSHIFSQKSVMEFEPHILQHVQELLDKWDQLYDGAVKGLSGPEGEGGWSGKDGRLWLDCLPWVNYLAFDIIGDLAFGAPFGMIQACKDSVPIPKNFAQAMDSYGKDVAIETKEIPAVQILNGRGEYSMSMGALPPWWRPWAKQLPWYRQGGKDVNALAGIAIVAVGKRLATPTDRNDLLSKLQAGKDENGNPMGREELTAEALTLLIAGSDTTSNSTCAIIYHLARTPHAQEKLHQALDEMLDGSSAATAAQVKNVPYLDAVINEALRIHSTSAMGLPRIVPKGGIDVMGHKFPEGAVLSVPSFTIHRDEEIWGGDVEAFKPERWFERDQNLIQKTFNPFSVGPRACVGRNLATLELQIIVASICRRFDFSLEHPGQELYTSEGFLRKPLGCKVGIKRRDVL